MLIYSHPLRILRSRPFLPLSSPRFPIMTTPAVKRKADDLGGSASKKPMTNASITSFFGAPKSSPSAPSSSNPAKKDEKDDGVPSSTPLADQAPSSVNTVSAFSQLSAPASATSNFNKEKWVEKLTPEQKDLLSIEILSLHESWLAALKDEILSKDFLDLKRFLKKERESGKQIFPPAEDLYSWYELISTSHRPYIWLERKPIFVPIRNLLTSILFSLYKRSRHTPLHTVKAVILGQDPYHNLNQAHGLCFSVRPPTPAPPSLKNIYIALRNDYPSFQAPPRNGGLLTTWADRGVLLLNACLTVRAHEPNSHSGKGWEKFTQKVIDTVAARRKQGVVFLAWGSPAQKRCAKVNGSTHYVLKSVHPSPLSAQRGWVRLDVPNFLLHCVEKGWINW